MGLLLPFLFLKPSRAGQLTVVAMAVAGVAISSVWFAVGEPFSYPLLYHPFFGAANVQADGLTALFVALVSVVFGVGVFYGGGYLSHYDSRPIQYRLHWVSVLVTFMGMLMLFTTDNLVVFLIGWELMAIGSFFAVIFENEKPLVLKAGINYFIQSHIAVLLITAVFAWVYAATGDLTFAGVRKFFAQADDTTTYIAFAMLAAGFGFKAGFVPFHSWLPHAHPAAPSHISALMSGVIVKAGIYGIARFATMIETCHTECGVTLLVIGVVSGLYGIINAAVHRDFKRMLAYCTIENVGIIAMGLGVGLIGLGKDSFELFLLGVSGALLHTVNHALFKALLFFGAGNIYVSAHTRNMEALGGLIKSMPRTALVFLIGSLAIGGLPPFGGFVSELLIYSGFLKGFAIEGLALPIIMVLSGGALAIIGGVSMLAFTKSFGVIFLGTPRSVLQHEPHEVSLGMLMPSYLLMVPMLLIMVLPGVAFNTVADIAVNSFGFDAASLAMHSGAVEHYAGVITNLGIAMVSFIAVVGLVFGIRSIFIKRRPVAVSDTWGCGYMRPIAGIQYTSKSFARTLADMFKLLLPSNVRFRAITTEEIFPRDRGHMSSDTDFCETRAISPVTNALLKLLNKFQFVQNGNLQRYIVYGLAYVVILILTATIF